MGWWDDGDHLMGDEPADQVEDLFRTLTARLAKDDWHHVTVSGLAKAFGEAVAQEPALVSPAVSGVSAREALQDALTTLCVGAGYAPVVREFESSDLGWIVANAARRLSMAWVDSGATRRPRLGELVSAFTFVVRPAPERYLALHEPVSDRPALHPLVGVPRATLADLRSRCEPDALALLDLAARVARLRVHGALADVPTSRAALTLRSTDLLRALQAAGLIRGLADDYDWTSRFDEDTSRVRAILATDTDPPPEVLLDVAWAGYLTTWLAGRTAPIDATALLGALDRSALRALGGYQAQLAEGLLTEEEAVGRLAWGQGRLAGWSAWRPEWGVHLDRDGEVDALTAALASSKVVCVETDTPGRVLPLVQAWADRVGRRGELPVDGPWWGAEATLVLVVGKVPHVTTFQADDLEREPWREHLEELLGREGHVIVAASRTNGPKGSALGDAPVVQLGPRRDADLLARWLAVRSRSWFRTGARYDLFELFDAIAAADEEDRWSLDWTRLAPWADVPSRNRPRSSQLRRFLKAKRPLPFPRGIVYERFVRTEERLRWLVELDATLP